MFRDLSNLVIVLVAGNLMGKGTQGGILATHGFKHDVLSSRLQQAFRAHIEAGTLVPDADVNEVVDAFILSCKKHAAVADGYCRTLPQAQHFFEKCSESGIKIITVFLDVPGLYEPGNTVSLESGKTLVLERAAMRRVQALEDGHEPRADDQPDKAVKRYLEHVERMTTLRGGMSLASYFEAKSHMTIKLDPRLPGEEVTERLIHQLTAITAVI